MHRGVYLVGDRAAPPRAPEMAALLACGADAVLSHHTAAALHQLLPHPAPTAIHVITPGRALAQRPGLRIHRTKLDRRDTQTRNGLRLTTPARTILDLAAKLAPSELEPLIAAAQRMRLVSERSLHDQLTRNLRRPGTPSLRALLEAPHGPAFTRSRAERKLLGLIRAAGLPPPRTNVVVGDLEVDFLWPAQRLVAEFDSFTFHADRRAFERDRHRDGILQALGYAVVRITWRQLTEEPAAVVALLARMLERRSP